MRILATAALAAISVLVSTQPLFATTNSYTENFTTTANRNAANTTADWNTALGQVSLVPWNISIAKTLATPGEAWRLDAAGNTVYIADASSGLVAVDVTNPFAPSILGSAAVTTGFAIEVAVAGDLAFVGTLGGLEIFDISDPTSMTSLGYYNSGDFVSKIKVRGRYAFIADGGPTMRVINVGYVYGPSQVDSYPLSFDGRGIDVAGNLAYVCDAAGGVRVLDITDPTNLVAGPLASGITSANAIAVSGDEAYAIDYNTLVVLDVSSPASVSQLGSAATTSELYDIAVDGNYAYCVGDSGLYVFDIQYPSSPVLMDHLPTGGPSVGVDVDGDYAYVGATTGGLVIVNTAYAVDPPPFVSQAPRSGIGQSQVSGNVVYQSHSSGLRSHDITDPRHPIQLDTQSGGYTQLGDIDGNLLYQSYSGLRARDITDPSNIVDPGIFSTELNVRDLDVDGDYAYTVGTSGLGVFDISGTPSLVDSITHDDGSWVYKEGNRLFTYGFDAGFFDGYMRVYDLSIPFNPTFIGGYLDPATGGATYGMRVAGDLAFLAATPLHIVDISDPTAMTMVGTYTPPSAVMWDIEVAGNYLFAAEQIGGGGGFEVVDISNPASPVGVEQFVEPEFVSKITRDGDHVFVSGYTNDYIYQVFERNFMILDNVAESIVLDDSPDEIIYGRVSATQADSIQWELTADGGTTWEVFPNGTWQAFTTTGPDIKWRASLYTARPAINPTVSQLNVDWLYHHGLIATVEDFPNDQGKQVRVRWTKSGHDFIGDATQIIEYAIYRKIDENLIGSGPPALTADRPEVALTLPAGWDFVTTVPADVEDEYAVVVPTAADSTIVAGQYYTTFIVRARTATPGVYWDSPADSGYSVDNLAPTVPSSFAVAYGGGGNDLSWDDSPDADWQYFRVYRGTTPDFVHTPANLIHATTATSWTDTEGGPYYYKVTALDFSGNESDPASQLTSTAADDTPVLPTSFAVYQNMPNPFNPTTMIRYDVPVGGGNVTLEIFDVAGRLVRTLIDRSETAGAKTATWDGKDHSGAQVSSGIYFYRLRAGTYSKTLKMTLLQ